MFLVFIAFSIIMIFSNCKKTTNDTFCIEKRTAVSSISSQNAVVIYYKKYSKYGLKINNTIVGNIDNQIIGLVCDLQNELKTEGTNVIFSGIFKKFNSNENYFPQMGGDSLLYLEINQIRKQ